MPAINCAMQDKAKKLTGMINVYVQTSNLALNKHAWNQSPTTTSKPTT